MRTTRSPARVRRTSRRALLGALALLSVSRPARAEGELLARIARARAPLRTLQGPFVQIRTIGLLATEVRSRGTLTLVRPDRLRWQLDPPDDVTFWIGPEGLAYRSTHGAGRLPEATGRIGASLDDMRALLGGDLSKLSERWLLHVVRDDDAGAEIEATPRASKAGLSSMRFALRADLVRPTRVVLSEGPRDRTTLDFGELVVNGPVDEHAMQPPGGVP